MATDLQMLNTLQTFIALGYRVIVQGYLAIK
jgi:hypothetical protein